MMRRFSCVLFLLFSFACSLTAQTPDVERWVRFLEWNALRGAVPDDGVMGPLAVFSEAEFEGVLEASLRAFEMLGQALLPEELFLPELSLPLGNELRPVVDRGPFEADVRYGVPVRDSRRARVPVRVKSGGVVVYGEIYFYLRGDSWLMEQWSVDLNPVVAGQGAFRGSD